MQVASNFSEADNRICSYPPLLIPGQPDKVLQDDKFIQVGVGELRRQVDHRDHRLLPGREEEEEKEEEEEE